MSTNFYLNNFPSEQITSEQLLVEDLVIEALQFNGMDVYYLPRTVKDGNEIDYLYGEDTLKEYKRAYPIEMYLENVTGMDGEGDFISKFGLEIRDEISLLVSRKRFKFTTSASGLNRPREGDIVYVPLVRDFFEITFVENENDQAMFYTLGRGRGGNVYVYSLKMKKYVFSNEVVETGIESIDEQIRDNYFRTKISLSSGLGKFLPNEIVYQGTSFENATATAYVHNFSLSGPNLFIEVYRTNGTFRSGNIIGKESGAIWNSNVASDFASFDNAFEDIIDNNRIQNESMDIIDWSERNPFGEP
jgi:hypothetical protein